jgi:hypothetical protein
VALPPLTPWDCRLFGRAALSSALVLGIVLLVTATTDEGGIAWTERVSRTLPLAPACAAVGAWATLGPARARGETLALQALGRSPGEVAAAAALGAALVALVAGAALAWTPAVDVGAFFPRAVRASTWVWNQGGFEDRARGLRIGADGAPLLVSWSGVPPSAAVPAYGRAAAGLAIAMAGLALPLLVAHAILVGGDRGGARGGREWRRNLAGAVRAGCALTLAVVIFQAAAAERLPALTGVLPSVALLADALWRYRAAP